MSSPFNAASDRREFLKMGVKTGLATGAILAMADSVIAQQRDTGDGVPKRPLGKSGAEVSIVALGGHHIGQVGKKSGDDEAVRLIHRAIDEGITFFDNCWDYHDGYSEELMGKGIEDRRERVFLMTKVCDRDYEGAKKQLDESLKRLRTDHLDLWQFHEMVYDNDPDWVFEKGGIRAALEAQQAGKVKHIGFTGHKDPSIHLKMLAKPQQWASAQMPINVCDYHFRSFLHQVATKCNEVGTGVIGMKCMGGGNGNLPRSGVVMGEECLRFALSQPISSIVTGMLNDRDLDQALKVARGFKPLTADEQSAILAKTKDVAGDGRYELFKTAKEFDGPYHRKQHGFAV
jgi:predicted aldo/keto reductase-like oxidoreductase